MLCAKSVAPMQDLACSGFHGHAGGRFRRICTGKTRSLRSARLGDRKGRARKDAIFDAKKAARQAGAACCHSVGGRRLDQSSTRPTYRLSCGCSTAVEWGSNGSYPLSHSGSPDRPASGAPPAPDHGGGVLRDPFGGPWACQGRKGTYPPTAHTGRSRGAPGGSAPGTRRSPTCDRPPGRPPRRGRPPDTTSGNLRSPRSTLEDC